MALMPSERNNPARPRNLATRTGRRVLPDSIPASCPKNSTAKLNRGPVADPWSAFKLNVARRLGQVLPQLPEARPSP